MIGDKEHIEEDWEKISDQELIFKVEREEQEWREFWEWYKSQEGSVVLVSETEEVENDLPF